MLRHMAVTAGQCAIWRHALRCGPPRPAAQDRLPKYCNVCADGHDLPSTISAWAAA